MRGYDFTYGKESLGSGGEALGRGITPLLIGIMTFAQAQEVLSVVHAPCSALP